MLPLPNKIVFFEQEIQNKTEEELEKMIEEIEAHKPINWLSALAKTSQLEILRLRLAKFTGAVNGNDN